MKTKPKCILTVILALATVVSVQAEDVSKHEFHFSPYFWLPSMDVTSQIGPIKLPIDMDFGDIWDTFDVFALSARGEYWRGQYGVVADGLWMDMKKDGLGHRCCQENPDLSHQRTLQH